MDNKKIGLIVVVVAVIGIVTYLWKNKYISTPVINPINNEIEYFTALSGLNPLISYDDFGTFNFLLHTDDLPYYDKGFASIFCGKPDYNPNEKGFFDYEGFKVKKTMIPSNYTNGMNLGSPNDSFGKNFLVRKDRPRASYVPPLPENYFF